jgi:hypothetical protein
MQSFKFIYILLLVLWLRDNTAPVIVVRNISETILKKHSLIDIEKRWNGDLQEKLQAFGEMLVLLLRPFNNHSHRDCPETGPLIFLPHTANLPSRCTQHNC